MKDWDERSLHLDFENKVQSLVSKIQTKRECRVAKELLQHLSEQLPKYATLSRPRLYRALELDFKALLNTKLPRAFSELPEGGAEHTQGQQK